MFGVVRAEERHFVREEFSAEYVVLHCGIIEHDFARRLNGFCVEKDDSKAAVVGVLRTSGENYHPIFRKLFQVAEMFRDDTRLELSRTTR